MIDDELITESLSAEDSDILGEVGNITMGTAATALSAIVQQKTDIDTPTVRTFVWPDLQSIHTGNAVGVRIKYEEGLTGSNILILKERDVKIITDLMMGGVGTVIEPVELTEMDMSAISEAMNQMVGATATSLSSMLKKEVNISPPTTFSFNFSTKETDGQLGFSTDHQLVTIRFRLVVGDLLESEVMQIFRLDDGQELVNTLKQSMLG